METPGSLACMVRIHPFDALMPTQAHAQEVAAVPYDVVSTVEAAATIRDNPISFLNVSRADAVLPEVDPHSDTVYHRAAENLAGMIKEGILTRDLSPSFYLYRVQAPGRVYTGIAACVETADFVEGRIRMHEATRYDKEADRTRHILATGAHTGPVVLLANRGSEIIASAGDSLSGSAHLEVHDRQGARHTITPIRDPLTIQLIREAFSAVPALYIADGHHRAKSAVNAAAEWRRLGIRRFDTERFLAVIFSCHEVTIHGYSRLLVDTGALTPDEFLARLGEVFSVRPYGPAPRDLFQIPPRIQNTGAYHLLHLYMHGQWYECSRPIDTTRGLVAALDVAVLQDNVLAPILGITDPRGDPRIHYLGGARPIADLEAEVEGRRYVAAFAMQPVQIETVLAIADNGLVMPPKSTWFEPKLLSGLLVHQVI